jgi:hypothetical protein
MEDIPNKAVNNMGLVVDVNLHEKAGLHYIEIIVPPSHVPNLLLITLKKAIHPTREISM